MTWQRRTNERVRSRKHTLRLQAQRSNRSEAESEALLAELAELEEDHRTDYCHTAMVKEYILGERPSAAFYEKVKASRGKGHAIHLLADPETGRETADVKEMLGIAQNFYGALYAAKPSDKAARRGLLRNLDRRVEPRFRQMLSAPFSGSEIRAAIGRGKLGRSPGGMGCRTIGTRMLMRRGPKWWKRSS